MALVNAFGDLALDASVQAVLTELQQKLEPGQAVTVSSVGGTVTVSGTVGLDAASLAALEAIDVRQSGSWSVTVTGSVTVGNFPAVQPVSDNGGSLTVDGTVNVGNFPASQPVSGTVSVSNFPSSQPVTGPLTDTQLRAAAVPVSVSFPATQNVAVTSSVEVEVKNDAGSPLPVNGTVAVGNFPASQPVTDNGGSLTTDGSYDERYSGGKSAYATTVNAIGDTTLVTPAAGKAIRVVWVSAIPSPDNVSANRVRFKFGAGGAPFYEAYAVAHWEVFQGAVNTPLVLNAATAEPVSVTVHYREV